ncbi:hypothetical protein EJ110_NYTH16188 [Nymphaea thermarum]|nr:hypothetical protein EJ110_NYTH16188 [Nymphaea thermarum]
MAVKQVSSKQEAVALMSVHARKTVSPWRRLMCWRKLLWRIKAQWRQATRLHKQRMKFSYDIYSSRQW